MIGYVMVWSQLPECVSQHGNQLENTEGGDENLTLTLTLTLTVLSYYKLPLESKHCRANKQINK